MLGKTHGVAGEIALRLYNHEPSELGDLDSVLLVRDGRRETRAVEQVRPYGTTDLLIRLRGVTTREQAAALTHSEVRVDRASLPPPAPGEFYVSDIPGCVVLDDSGARLGVVRETFWNGAHDIMVVIDDDGAAGAAATEHMIPLIPDFVRAVDGAGRTVRVEWKIEDGVEDGVEDGDDG